MQRQQPPVAFEYQQAPQMQPQMPPAAPYYQPAPQPARSQRKMQKAPPPFDPEEDDESLEEMEEEIMTTKKQQRQRQRKKSCPGGTCSANGFCLPLVIYFVISALLFFGFLLSKQTMMVNIGLVIFELLWIAIFAWLIYYFCKTNNMVGAWIALVVPLIIQIVLIVVAGVWII